MEITRELQELAKFSESTLPVFSVYLNTPMHEPLQRDHSAAFLDRHIQAALTHTVGSDAARASLERDLQRIKHWGEQHLRGASDAAATGWALFTSSGADLWVEFPSPLPLVNQFVMADRPALWQLVCLDANYTNALVVLMDAHSARVCDVVLGGLLSETDFVSAADAPHGRDSRNRLSSRELTLTAVEPHYHEVVEYLTAYLADRPQTYVIMGGQDEVVSQFCTLLPQPVRRQIIDDVSLTMHNTPERILQVARQTLEQYDRAEDRQQVQELLTQAESGGGAVLGLADTVTAVNARVVQKLIVQQDFGHPGWRCPSCDIVGAGTVQQCAVCSSQVLAVELREALVSEVLRNEGFVEPVASDDRLGQYDGIGAWLHSS